MGGINQLGKIALANMIALEASLMALRSYSKCKYVDGVEWRDINVEVLGVPLGSYLKKELRYLKLCDALIWSSLEPNLVRVGGAFTDVPQHTGGRS